MKFLCFKKLDVNAKSKEQSEKKSITKNISTNLTIFDHQ